MPHLTLEYSSNLASLGVNETLQALNQALAGCGQFEEADIKSRAQAFEHCVVGIAPQGRAFAHIKLAILSGRSAEAKLALSQLLLQTLEQCLPPSPGLNVQLCAEILEIDRASYSKSVIAG